MGARILRQVPFLAPHLPIVELHHERLLAAMPSPHDMPEPAPARLLGSQVV